jgi:photosystem II stability/assembly factor-like uncharacterized protein
LHAQEWVEDLPDTANFFQLRDAFNAYWGGRPLAEPGREDEENSEYMKFRRWENFMRTRVDENGHFPNGQLLREWERTKTQRTADASSASATASWTFTGPATMPGNGGGMGRLNTIEFEPGNSNVIYVGSASGGLWKSIDGGTTWSTSTDQLVNLGIADIAIDPTDVNTIYIATGDGCGYEVPYFWGGTYSAGVLKSTDGGSTWNTTGLSFQVTGANIIQRLQIIPSSPNILIAAARDGIHRSTDAGVTWTLVSGAHVTDMELNPADPTVLYAAGNAAIFRSADMGATWAQIPGIYGDFIRTSLGVTPADPNIVYAFSENGDLFKSTDAGFSYSLVPGSPTSVSLFYGYYDLAFAVSPGTSSILIAGGLEVMGSTDGGLTWAPMANWYGWPGTDYVHADNHDISFKPGNPTTFFACTDGGLFKTGNFGGSWSDLSSGIQVSQLYRIGISQSDSAFFYAGAQDNGVIRKNTAGWDVVIMADGMESVINPVNSSHALSSQQNGWLSITTDGGDNWNSVMPSNTGEWTIPLVMDQTNPNIVYAGYETIYKSTDGGFTFTPLPFFLTGTQSLTWITVAPSNPNIIYAGNDTEAHISSDGGLTWTDISAGLPVTNSYLTRLAISGTDPQTAWITLAGYSAGNKVFKTTDGGASWTNISGTLPNIPVNCIIYHNGSNDDVFIGTDFGVYYRNASMTDWASFTTGLPNVIVHDLEIHNSSNTLIAATYGRGVWQTPLPFTVGQVSQEQAPLLFAYPNPAEDKLTVETKSREAVIELCDLRGRVVLTENAAGRERVSMDVSALANGLYFVRIKGDSAAALKVAVRH